jgi:hypothetical protein
MEQTKKEKGQMGDPQTWKVDADVEEWMISESILELHHGRWFLADARM